jgi:phage terminase small subunit
VASQKASREEVLEFRDNTESLEKLFPETTRLATAMEEHAMGFKEERVLKKLKDQLTSMYEEYQEIKPGVERLRQNSELMGYAE